jgi:hypothetical protein
MRNLVSRFLVAVGFLVVGLTGCDDGGGGSNAKPKLQTYDQAVQYYTTTFKGESMAPTNSTAVSQVTYYPESGEGVMTLSFVKTPGKVYIFRGVPPDVWESFKGASSKGNFYNTQIKRKYPFALDQ